MTLNLISVIVPIYNQQENLDRSIQSILNQKYENLEIILVNDGSTDESLSIMRHYEKKDSRIIIIDKSNGGVSSARNEGLKLAKGDLIGFIDPDDWIDSNMYSSMYNNLVKNNAEVVLCNYSVEKSDSKSSRIINTNKTKMKKDEIVNFLIADMINMDTLDISRPSIMGSVCRMLIKKDMIFSNEITFDENIPYMEDLLFVIDVLFNTDVAAIDSSIHYHYNQIDGSASNRYLSNFFENHLEVFQKIKKLMINYNYMDVLDERLKYRYIYLIMNTIKNEARSSNPKKETKKLKKIKKLLKDNDLKRYIKNIDYKSYSTQRKFLLNSIEKERALVLLNYYKLTNFLRDKRII